MMAASASSREERLDDIFQDEILLAFADTTGFQKFARSNRGLCLDEHVIQDIVEDHEGNVEEQKMKILYMWKEKNGEEATVSKIRNLVISYKKEDDSKERLEDIFQDEILLAFADTTEFQKFARSNRGLCLKQYVIQEVVDDHKGNVEEQKMKILYMWKEKNGEEATGRKIRNLVAGYKMGDDPKGYISLDGGRFTLCKEQLLCEQGHVFFGVEENELIGSKICAIKLQKKNNENLREAQNLSRLKNHVNVVSILHAGIHRSDLYEYIFIAMELSWTDTVRIMLKENTPFNEFISTNLVRQILKAVDFIHSFNIIHRDLKPDNMLLSKDKSQLKVTDFEYSKKITTAFATKQTKDNIGTDGYRSAETYNISSKISTKSDIFSAGVTIAEILANGRHPFGINQYLWSENIINNQNLDLSHLLVSNNIQVENLLKHMLEVDPEKRPTAGEVLNDVQNFQTWYQLKNQHTLANQSFARSSMTQLQRSTVEDALLPQLINSSQPGHQQPTGDQLLATASMTQLQRSTDEDVLLPQLSTSSQPRHQQPTGDQSLATTSIRRPSVLCSKRKKFSLITFCILFVFMSVFGLPFIIDGGNNDRVVVNATAPTSLNTSQI